MDAKIRAELERMRRETFAEGEREEARFPTQKLRLINNAERAYARSVRMVQGLPLGRIEAHQFEHYYVAVPGDREGWCAVCGEEPTFSRHRGASSASKDFIIGAYELYTQICRFYEVVATFGADARDEALKKLNLPY